MKLFGEVENRVDPVEVRFKVFVNPNGIIGAGRAGDVCDPRSNCEGII